MIAKVGGAGRQAIVGTGLYQLHAYGENANEPPGWPKFTGGWIFATPTVGDLDGNGKLDVVTVTREGFAFAWHTGVDACGGESTTNDEWWTFHHDEHGTARYGHDARPPGAPRGLTRVKDGKSFRVEWKAPGDDLLCGRAERYRAHRLERSRERAGGRPRDRHRRGRSIRRRGRAHGRAAQGGQSPRRGLPRRGRQLGAGGQRARRTGLPAPQARGQRQADRPGQAGREAHGAPRLATAPSGAGSAPPSSACGGGGRFVVAARKGRVDLVATTARRHRTRSLGPGQEAPPPARARRAPDRAAACSWAAAPAGAGWSTACPSAAACASSRWSRASRPPGPRCCAGA